MGCMAETGTGTAALPGWTGTTTHRHVHRQGCVRVEFYPLVTRATYKSCLPLFELIFVCLLIYLEQLSALCLFI